MNGNPRAIKLNDIPYRSTKSFTPEERNEIIEFYNTTKNMYETCLKFKVRCGAIKQWTDPEYVEKCRQKARDIMANWSPERKQASLDYAKNYRNENKEQIKQYQQQYAIDNADIMKQRRQNVYQKIKNDPILYQQAREKNRELERKWSDTRPEYKAKAHARAYARRLVSQINKSTEVNYQKQKHSVEYIGCTPNELVDYIVSQFQPGMEWNSKDKKWEIDHIIPLAFFDFKRYDPEKQMTFLNNYKNLRPMWAGDNNDKHDFVWFKDKFVVVSKHRQEIFDYIEQKFKKPYFECTHEELIKEFIR